MRIIVGVLVVFLFLVDQSEAKPNTKITMLFTDEYPPFYFIADKKGMYIDFLASFEQSHPQYHIQRLTLSRKRIDAKLIDGSVDAYSLTSTQFLPGNIHPKYQASKVIWVTADVLISLNAAKLTKVAPEQLIGRSIGVIHGNDYMHYNPYFENDSIHRINAYVSAELLAMLYAKRIEGVIINQHGLPSHLKNHGYNQDSFHVAKNTLYEFDLVTMVSKEKIHFLHALNAFIDTQRQNGVLAKLESKHLFTSISRQKPAIKPF